MIPMAIMLILTLLLLIIPTATSRGHNCSLLHKQQIAEKTIHLAWKSGVLSSLSYLQYEQEQLVPLLPHAVSFETTGFKSLLQQLFHRKLCQLQNVVRRCRRFLMGALSFPVRIMQSLVRLIRPPNKIKHRHQQAISPYVVCPMREKNTENFAFRWFFGDWKEGMWHDTEVLLAESNTIAAIVFRGSDTTADLFTNSQTMEPATHSYYFGCVDGALHRGMLNAYARVDRGKLVPLDVDVDVDVLTVGGKGKRGGGSSAFGRSIVDTYQRLYRHKYGSSNGHNHSGIRSNDSSTAVNTTHPPTVDVSNQLLSNLLIPAVLSALKSGKHVVLTGHSLGGSLALLLALDVLTNHCAPSEAETEVLSTPTTDNPPRDSGVEQGDGMMSSSTSSTHPNHQCKHHQSSKSRSNLGGRRCPVDGVDPRLFDRLHVITFGQPDVADAVFFDDLRHRFPAVDAFLSHRYQRFIGISNKCELDIVPQLVDRVGSVLGHRLSGIRKRNQKKTKHKSSNTSKSKPTTSTTPTDSNATNIKNQGNKESMGGVSLTEGQSTSTSTTSSHHDIIPGQTGALMINTNNTAQTTSAEPPSQQTTSSSTSESALSCEFGRCYYLASRHAESSIEAHAMSHYLHGLHYMGMSYDIHARQTSTGTRATSSHKGQGQVQNRAKDKQKHKHKKQHPQSNTSNKEDMDEDTLQMTPGNEKRIQPPPASPNNNTNDNDTNTSLIASSDCTADAKAKVKKDRHRGIVLTVGLSIDTALKLDLIDPTYALTLAQSHGSNGTPECYSLLAS